VVRAVIQERRRAVLTGIGTNRQTISPEAAAFVVPNPVRGLSNGLLRVFYGRVIRDLGLLIE
jgi:hypothetical protein